MPTALVRDLDDEVYERLKRVQRAITAPLRPNFGRSWYWPRSRSMYRRLGQQPMRCVGGSRAARIVTAERCRRRNACGERTTRVGSESRPTARRLAALPFRPTLGAPGRCSRFRWDSQSLSHFLARESPSDSSLRRDRSNIAPNLGLILRSMLCASSSSAGTIVATTRP